MTKELPAQTEQKHQWEAKLKMALDAAQMSIWTLDIHNHQITSAINLEAIFSLEKDSCNHTYEAILNCVHTQDRDFLKRVHQQAIKDGREFEIEYRIVLADDSICWLVSKGVIWRDSSGVPVQMCVVDMDISKRKQDEAELQQQNLRCLQQATLTQLFANITLKIRQSLQIDEILETSVTEVQKLLQADRVLILKLHSNRSFLAVKEAVIPGLPVVMGQTITDSCFAEDYVYQKYCQGQISAISNIETAQIQLCHVEFLQQFAVKANLVVPIFQKNQLWGLLVAHQCLHTREWTDWEIELLRQLADQIGIALAQSLILEQETHQRQELIRSNEELQQFAFIASHDLQEPLRKIRTFGDLLKVTCRDSLSTQGYDYLERMQKAALRMQTLIDDLLTLSRVTTKAKPFVSVNLSEIAQEVLSDLEVRIQQTGGRVEIGYLPIIQADPLQMRQLLQNLIGNALKFHRQNQPPVVRIFSQLLNNDLDDFEHKIRYFQIIVEDNGIGLPEAYLDRIFHVFQRLHSLTEYEGTGIGLAICRKITERHHGSIKAQNTPGQGAKFIVTLPIS
ncbi:ATP-binding protein [Anabaena sp. PCC 7108]|uniref:PAS domain-containing sensor histidine kinase n=1 Tax=Anabaena sp. PCC 7108 TaxID=163908 RepID=UPI000347CF49|nr:ATP-binding protein [Anabaena sp. PCC 7108]